jgi:hypothetical protein
MCVFVMNAVDLKAREKDGTVVSFPWLARCLNFQSHMNAGMTIVNEIHWMKRLTREQEERRLKPMIEEWKKKKHPKGRKPAMVAKVQIVFGCAC